MRNDRRSQESAGIWIVTALDRLMESTDMANLIDRFGRRIDDLRLYVTDRCDLR